MRIINHGKGIHQREVPGITYLQKHLPDDWIGHTNLALSLPLGAREIDLIVFAIDRIFLIDLKDGHGKYASVDGGWTLNGKSLDGQSPVQKILDNTRETHILLANFLEKHSKRTGYPKLLTPRLYGAVILTSSHDLNGIAPTEINSVFTAKQFVTTVKDTNARIERFGGVPPDFVTTPICSVEWGRWLNQFFNVSSGYFKHGVRRYGEYIATEQSSANYIHKQEIFQEFIVNDVSAAQAVGLLRRWDFSKADTRFQTESGRFEIAGRERSIIGWLNDRSENCANAVLQPKAEDPEKSVDYWEVYDLRKRMKRLSEFTRSELPRLRSEERIEIARQLIHQASCLHSYQTAHLDIGEHSVWIALPSEVKLSHLMTARYPEAESLGEKRYQFLSNTSLPDDIIDFKSTSEQKDVFHLGVLVHLILWGTPPKSDPPEWDPSIDVEIQFKHLHHVLERAIAWDNSRYADASAFLDEFNNALKPLDTGTAILKRLDTFKSISSQRQLFRQFPDEIIITDNDFKTIWISEKDAGRLLGKLWKRASWSDGGIDQPRILDFLEKARQFAISPPPGCVQLREAYWLSDSFAIIQDYVDAPNLASHIMMLEPATLDAAKLIKFLFDLVECIIKLHDSGHAHGDLKPDNILVYGEDMEPKLIDYLDFSCQADGEISTSAYAPSLGGTLERDRFAITKIVEELLAVTSLDGNVRASLGGAISECRGTIVANATLLPLRDALANILRPEGSEAKRSLSIALSESKSIEILPDEGFFGYGFNKNKLFIRGVSDILYFSFANKILNRVKCSSAPQAEHRRLLRMQEGIFSASIKVVGGVQDSYAEFIELFKESPFFELISSKFSEGEQAVDESDISVEYEDPEDSGEVTQADTDEDAVTEIIEKNNGRTKSSTPELWRALVDVEVSLTNEATTLGPSTFRKETKLHAVPITLECGTFEFSRHDKVTVEKMGNDNRWRRVGLLDVSKSSAEFIHIDDGGRNAFMGNLLDSDQRLRFQSQLHFSDITRREAAVKRILNRESVVRNLIDYFDPAVSPPVTEQIIQIDELEIQATYGLNQRQAEALVRAFQIRPMTLLQGPPGTGKTRWIGALVHYALSKNIVRNVLIASQSHEAVNNAAQAVLKLFPSTEDAPSIIRIGQEEKVSEQLLPYHVAKVEQLYKDKFRATLKQRLKAASISIGLPDDVTTVLIQIETTLSPVFEQLNALSVDIIPEGVLVRVKSLLQTVETLLSGLDIDVTTPKLETLPDSFFMDDIYSAVARKFHCAPDLIDKLRSVSRLTQDIIGSVSTADRSFETFLAGTRQIVAGTCVGLGRSSLGLTSTAFDLVIIDEAARCSASELAVPMQAGRWIVLVGDQRQLEPRSQEKVVSVVADQTGYPAEDIVKSAFEQVFETPLGAKISQKLNVQYRMLPSIGRVVADTFYNKDLKAGRSETEQEEKIIPVGFSHPLTWIYTDEMGESSYQKQHIGRGRKSLINQVEIDLIVGILSEWNTDENFLAWLRKRRNVEPAIGVICTYGAQAAAIRHKIQLANLNEDLLNSLKVDTVDSYQGKENRIVILSLVRNNADGARNNEGSTIRPGFMSRPNRINVAISRAMDWLIIVGASSRWAPAGPMAELVKHFSEEVSTGQGAFVNAVGLLAKQREHQTNDVSSSRKTDNGEESL
ncbi:AAA domain-containing protein [Pseudomonas sp. A1437]|uniref:AAA domain-containing protein n=1 Tax=unclassified Pseudomonas TaxID=196821 RepID=UPI0037836A01